MLVEDILAQKGHRVFAVKPDCSVREMATIIATRNIGTTIVTDEAGSMLGIISERDLVRALSEFEEGHLELKVGDLMTRSIVTCAPETTVADALSLMGSHRIRHLPVVEDGNVIGLISIRDLLEFRLEGLEENFAALIRAKRETSHSRKVAELVDRAKAEFMQTLGYQLGAPLDTIVDIAEYLVGEIADVAAPPQFAQYLGELAQTGHHLRALVHDLLELSLLQAQAAEPVAEAVDVAEVAAQCLREMAEQAERKGVAMQLGPTLARGSLAQGSVDGAALHADRRMLGRMLYCLLDNAVKFTPSGGGVTVSFDRDGEGVGRVSVADTGIGIPGEHLAKVAAPFYRVETALARDRKGAGLGLALVDAMVRAHGGVLGLESRIGIGTTATLSFPSASETPAERRDAA
jgi:signal transduction histidine kinase